MISAYQAKTGFVKRTIAGETLLVPVGKTTQEFNGMVMLNETGSYLWDLMQEPKTKEELVVAMKAEFDATEEELIADIDEFVEYGQSQGMLLYIEE